jgi:EpsI family protein
MQSVFKGKKATQMAIKQTLIASAIMIFTAVFLNYVSFSEDMKLHKPFSTFPKQIGEWQGVEQRFEDRIYKILGVDDSILATYRNSDGKQVQLYVGYYQSQRKGDLIHSPKNCMPGSGWNIVSSSIEELSVPDTDYKKIKTIRFKLKNGLHEQSVLYWYQSRGRIISSEYLQKIYLVIDSITRRRTDGSFVRLIAPIQNGDEESTIDFVKDFARLIFPILIEYIPA